jgi:hypothetical protein
MTYKEQLSKQIELHKSLKTDLEKLNKSSLTHEEILQHQQRNNEILSYNNSKYQAKNKFLIQFTVAYGILIIFGALIYGKIIPRFIGEPIAILYGTLVSLYLLGVYTDISIRSQRYFYKYNFMKHDSKNTGDDEDTEKLQCLGEECCPQGTTYNEEDNICVVNSDENEKNLDDTEETTNVFEWANFL